MAQVEIFEVGPRDGLQNEPGVVPTATKIEFIERMIAAGLRRIEVASFVNPPRVPQMADAEEILRALPRRVGVSYVGLVLNRRGFDRAARRRLRRDRHGGRGERYLQPPQPGCEHCGVDRRVARYRGAASAAGIRAQVTISAVFGCPFEGEVPPARVVDIARQVAESATLSRSPLRTRSASACLRR